MVDFSSKIVGSVILDDMMLSKKNYPRYQSYSE